jgi:hypothetical protein
MTNVSNYIAKKAKSLATIAKVGDAYAVTFKKFSPEDGSELDAEVQAISLEELEKNKTDLQNQISDIEMLIADCKAAN